MHKSQSKKIISYLIFILCITSCVLSGNESKNSNPQSFFIIDYNVNLYSGKESSDVLKIMTFFDVVDVKTEDLMEKGRLNVKLRDGMEGWVDEKYTSFIPREWKKLTFFENYYCYIKTNKKMDFKKEEDAYGKVYHYGNSDFKLSMGVIFLKSYKQHYDSVLNILSNEIKVGRDKKRNWSKGFLMGSYQINYVITTDHPDGYIAESFDFAKVNEMSLNKYYSIGYSYDPFEPVEKKLFWRKILFSTLQSLK